MATDVAVHLSMKELDELEILNNFSGGIRWVDFRYHQGDEITIFLRGNKGLEAFYVKLEELIFNGRIEIAKRQWEDAERDSDGERH